MEYQYNYLYFNIKNFMILNFNYYMKSLKFIMKIEISFNTKNFYYFKKVKEILRYFNLISSFNNFNNLIKVVFKCHLDDQYVYFIKIKYF